MKLNRTSKRSTLHLCLAFLLGVLVPIAPAGAQRATGTTMSASDAHVKALAGEIVLVDVRAPEEWKDTGIPATAHAITMHQDPKRFVDALRSAVGGDQLKPLAVICRTGNRTSAIYAELERIGFQKVINVVEGVAGGPYGPGWTKTGLPLRSPAEPRMSSAAR